MKWGQQSSTKSVWWKKSESGVKRAKWPAVRTAVPQRLGRVEARSISTTLSATRSSKKSIITVQIDNGHTPSIVLCKKSLEDGDHCQPKWSIHPSGQLRSSKGEAVGRNYGTVEGHYKGTAKGPNAIRWDNGTWKRCRSNKITGWWSNWRIVRWYSWNSGWCNSRRMIME